MSKLPTNYIFFKKRNKIGLFVNYLTIRTNLFPIPLIIARSLLRRNHDEPNPGDIFSPLHALQLAGRRCCFDKNAVGAMMMNHILKCFDPSSKNFWCNQSVRAAQKPPKFSLYFQMSKILIPMSMENDTPHFSLIHEVFFSKHSASADARI
jgi:hypothetical protein